MAIDAFMSQSEFERLTKSVGVACFVKYYNELADFAVSDVALSRIMGEVEGYTEAAC